MITYDVEIEQIVQSIFATMLNLDLTRIPEPSPTEDCRLMASIQIAGDSVGTVVLDLSPTLAVAATAAMLNVSVHEVTDVDQQDVVAELVNMVGGNLKSLLPGSSNLSLPTVITGRAFGLHIPGAALTDEVWLGSELGQLRVALFSKSARDRCIVT